MSSELIHAFISRWHAWLGLPYKPASWYRARLAEELIEQAEARGRIARLSETADVYYTITRARSDGHLIAPMPAPRRRALPYLYMVAKFTSRCAFYRCAAWCCHAPSPVREVVNPSKPAKRHEVALRHGIDPVRFQKVCRRLLRVWPLLP